MLHTPSNAISRAVRRIILQTVGTGVCQDFFQQVVGIIEPHPHLDEGNYQNKKKDEVVNAHTPG